MAPSIVGNSDDVRDLLAFELEQGEQENVVDDDLPALLKGWRGHVVGQSFRELLNCGLAIRVANKFDDQPLEFVAVPNPSKDERIF